MPKTLTKILKFFLLTLLCIGCASIEQRPKSGERGPPPSLQKIWGDPDQLLKEAKKSYEESNYPLALIALERILMTYPKSGVYEEAKKLAEDVQNRIGVAGFKIGVLLPLTGPFSRFGESALDGISCAVGLFDPCSGHLNKVQIVVRDTQGNPNLAAEAIRDLATKEHVAAIVGPLVSAEVEMAASQAQALNIAMITLAPQEGITKTGNFIFQHSLLAASEVTALISQATKSGLKKFIIIYPKNRYGEQYHALFVNGLQSSGAGKIIAETGYAPDIPDFVGIVEQLTKQPVVEKALNSEQASKIGIFIPDSYKEMSQIAEALETLSIQGPKLIGTSRSYHPQLLSHPFAPLEGVLIATPFFPDANREATHQFSDSFYKAFGNQPAWLEAFGYDAARFVLYGLETKGNDHPVDIRDALLTLQNYPSVVGPLSWDEARISKWPLDFVTVHDGKFSQLGGQ